jgi:hypothetical protein
MFPRSTRFADVSAMEVPGPGEYEVLADNTARKHGDGKQFGTSKRFDKVFAVLQDMSSIKNRRATAANLGTPEASDWYL